MRFCSLCFHFIVCVCVGGVTRRPGCPRRGIWEPIFLGDSQPIAMRSKCYCSGSCCPGDLGGDTALHEGRVQVGIGQW